MDNNTLSPTSIIQCNVNTRDLCCMATAHINNDLIALKGFDTTMVSAHSQHIYRRRGKQR